MPYTTKLGHMSIPEPITDKASGITPLTIILVLKEEWD